MATLVNNLLTFVAAGLLSGWLTSSALAKNQDGAPAGEAVFNVYLTGRTQNGIPSNEVQTQYDCSEKIYLVLEVTGLETGEHLLHVRWFDPRDKLEEITRYQFHYFGDNARVWAWLRLSGSPGGAIGRVFDPSFGMGKFIGEWRAEVEVNDKPVSKQKFQVLC